jgi:hypothetical protein
MAEKQISKGVFGYATWGKLIDDYERKTSVKHDVMSEVGTPGAGNTGTGNMVEPMPENKVPSLKRRQHVITDDEEEELEEKVMPDAAKKRKQLRQERIGKSGAIQSW